MGKYTQSVTVRLPRDLVAKMDLWIAVGLFRDRTDCISRILMDEGARQGQNAKNLVQQEVFLRELAAMQARLKQEVTEADLETMKRKLAQQEPAGEHGTPMAISPITRKTNA